MTDLEKENYDIAQLVIFNQLCVEANDRLQQYPKFYRHQLKKASNDLQRELEKHLPLYDEVYKQTEDFLLLTQQQIEYLVPVLRGLRLDELAMLPFLVKAYREYREKTEEFLRETLNVEMK